jgi:transcriptional regulator with XRE-family HTH domain
MPIRLNVDRLRDAAKTAGHTTDALIATHTGVSASTISRLARPGTSQEAKVSTFRALGLPYGLSVDDLLLEEDDDEPVGAAA